MPSPFIPRLSDQMLPRIQAHVQRCGRDADLGQALTGKALAAFGIYTGWEIYLEFLRTHLPPGEYLFAGAGPSSEALIAALQAPSFPLRIAGFIEPGRAAGGSFMGCPVLSAGEAARGDRHEVIVCNQALEKTLVAELLEAGMPRHRIHSVHGHEGFRTFHDAMLKQELAGRFLRRILAERPRVEHVILVPSRDIWTVIEEDALQEALPPETTIRLYYGPPGRMDLSPHYPTFDMGQCLPLILQLLEALAPMSVYVRGSAQFKTEHLGAAVKASLPRLFLAFEVYDYAGMLDDVFLETWGYSPGLAEDVRDAEAFLAANADFTIDKTPGDEWEKAAQELFKAPRRSYSPTLGIHWEDPVAPRPRDPGPFRIICAGSMPYFKNYRPGQGFPHWAYQNIIDPIVLLSREEDFWVDIFNASHDPALDQGAAFGGYAGLFDARRVAYHARVPLKEIMERVDAYDFGMFLFSASDVPIDYPLQQSLPNRCMSYISGNLPLIVNTEMRHLASLVETFHAGITLSSTEIADLPRRIREADLKAMKAGATALHRHLVASNHEALQVFKARLSEHQERVREP
jgi:hypothetical protein